MFSQSSSVHRKPLPDVELLPIDSRLPDHGRRRLIHTSSEPEDTCRLRECQQILQDGHPTFVPSFFSLRDTCIKRTCKHLRYYEEQIEISRQGSQERDILIDQATDLLRDLDRQFDSITDLHQLEDPEYAANRGLSLTHFMLDSGDKKGNWMLLSSDWGSDSRSIIESDPSRLTLAKKEWLKNFNDGMMPPIVAFKRRKTVLERQHGAVVERDKIWVPDRRKKMIWGTLLGLGFAALICFLGVGIIATTTTFSPIFVQYFFWIAIIWTLASTSLLVLIVRAYGGNGKDCMSAFLAGVAIWLVVIQIGQTKLNGQLGVN
ncbi:hypothetical protein AC579_4177 [Pseudocercospora musae]|uniref:Uncharacterized protein n=1 Tax=Pseudocercospora musae TaxID=113226 RepID=A0A139IAT7_9PEZI|nr:hypothetical protein AC579_4177 [Pseudocercospora musae]